jgi:putative cardiolipin synthase
MAPSSALRSMRQHTRTDPRRRVRRAVAALGLAVIVTLTSAACTTPRPDVPRPFSQAWPRPEETVLGREFEQQLAGHPGKSGFYPLASGMDAFTVRASLAETAERTLDLQYFIVHEDTTTQFLLYRVLRAADRGVRVRLLIDDLDAAGRDFDLASFAAHPNIEVRAFNPFASRGPLGLSQLLDFLGDPARLNRRMHNKLWIADNAMAIVGGRNLGDEYFDAHGEVNFADLDILAAGSVVRDISRSFDDYWNSEWAVPIEALVAAPLGAAQLAAFERILEARLDGFRDSDYARALRETHLGFRLRSGQLPLIPADAIALYDPPAKISGSGADAAPRQIFASRMRPIVDTVQREVILISPYFIPSDEGIAVLGAVARRGVRVRILTNSLASTDYVPLAYAGYARLRARLLAAGLELYEMRPEPRDAGGSRRPLASSGAYLHTKAVVVDRRHVVIGSMNLDPRSRLYNTEVAVLLESSELGARLGTLFEEAVRPTHAFRVERAGRGQETELVWITEEAGKEVRYDREPLAGFWRRLLAKLLGAFAPEDLL